MVTLSGIWQDEMRLRRVFSWLTRIKAGVKFGCRPIGWYQNHQCKCIDILEARMEDSSDYLRCRKGIIQELNTGTWVDVISSDKLYREANRLTTRLL